jgi:hypothetical protein
MSHGKCVVAAWWSMCTFGPHYACHFKRTFPGPQDRLSMLNQHLPCYYPGHQVVLTLLYRITLCGTLSRVKWQCTAVAKVNSCAQLWNRLSPVLHHDYFGACHTECISASGCVCNMMHIHNHMMCNTSQQMLKWSAGKEGYGDCSPSVLEVIKT